MRKYCIAAIILIFSVAMGKNSSSSWVDDYHAAPINHAKNWSRAPRDASNAAITGYNYLSSAITFPVQMFRYAWQYTVGAAYQGSQLGMKGFLEVMGLPNRFHSEYKAAVAGGT